MKNLNDSGNCISLFCTSLKIIYQAFYLRIGLLLFMVVVSCTDEAQKKGSKQKAVTTVTAKTTTAKISVLQRAKHKRYNMFIT